METQTITIRKASVKDKTYLNDLSVSMDITIAEALSYVVNKAKAPENNTVNNEETDKLKAEIKALTDNLHTVMDEKLALNNTLEEVNLSHTQVKDQLKDCEAELIDLKAEIAEKTLTGSQFVCQFEEHIAEAARKIRPFTKRDGFIDKEVANYPNALANIAVKQFINRNYSDYLK